MTSGLRRAYDARARRLYGLVLRVVRDPAQSEEVAQEAYLDIWRTSARFDPARAAPMSWMLTIAHRKAVDRVRLGPGVQPTARTAYGSRNQERPYDITAETVERSLDAQRVRSALDSLTETQREGGRAGLLRGLHAHRGRRPAGRPPRHGEDPNPRRADPSARHLGSAAMSADIHGLLAAPTPSTRSTTTSARRSSCTSRSAPSARTRSPACGQPPSSSVHVSAATPPTALRASVLRQISTVRPIPPVTPTGTPAQAVVAAR